MTQHEITERHPLLDENGHLIETGYARSLILDYDRKRIKANSLRIKEWDYYLVYNDSEIPLAGVKASGVKNINLKDDDKVCSVLTFSSNDEYVALFTNNKTAKRVKLDDLVVLTRAKRGNLIIKKTKTVTYNILFALIVTAKDNLVFKYGEDINLVKASDISIMDISSTGSSLKVKFEYIIKEALMEDITKMDVIMEQIELDLPKMNDDFLEEFKL